MLTFTNRCEELWIFGLPFHIIDVERQTVLYVPRGLSVAVFIYAFQGTFLTAHLIYHNYQQLIIHYYVFYNPKCVEIHNKEADCNLRISFLACICVLASRSLQPFLHRSWQNVVHTILHRTDLTIVLLTLQAIAIAPMISSQLNSIY